MRHLEKADGVITELGRLDKDQIQEQGGWVLGLCFGCVGAKMPLKSAR